MKITLREMFLIVLTVAVSLGWWVDRTRLLTDQHQERGKAQVYAKVSGEMLKMLRDAGCTLVATDNEFSIRSPSGKGFYIDAYKGSKDIPTEVKIIPIEPHAQIKE